MSDPAHSRRRRNWFKYSVTVGRISATPVHPMGWLSIIACIAAAIILAMLIAPPLARINPLLAVGGMLVTTTFSILLLVKLVVAKGWRQN